MTLFLKSQYFKTLDISDGLQFIHAYIESVILDKHWLQCKYMVYMFAFMEALSVSCNFTNFLKTIDIL
jgi:hypothetical protein